MPYGDCSLSKKLDDGGHRPLNSAVLTTSMAVIKTRVLRFSRLRIRGRETRTPAMPASCSDHDEAGGGNLPGFLDVFPAVPSKRLCGFHGYFNYEGISSPAASVWRTRRVVAGEWKTARKDCPSSRRLFVFPRRSIGGHSIFAPQEGKNSFPGVIKVPSLHEEAKRVYYAPGRCSSLKCSYLKCSDLICVHYTSVHAFCKLDVLSGMGKCERKLIYLFDCA